jgi:plastocyanin
VVWNRLRVRHSSAAALSIAALLAAGCSKKAEPPAPPPAATAAAPVSASGPGRVVGRVPAAGAAVVVLTPKDAITFSPQTEKPVMDQVGLTFGPELLIVRTGQPVEFRNSDDTLHNVNVRHEETREQAFNVAIPTGGTYEHTFPRDGFYRVGCDIHPAMGASIFSASTPFAAVAGGDGSFEFSEVPPGAWTLAVYVAGKQLRREVDVKGRVTEITVE